MRLLKQNVKTILVVRMLSYLTAVLNLQLASRIIEDSRQTMMMLSERENNVMMITLNALVSMKIARVNLEVA